MGFEDFLILSGHNEINKNQPLLLVSLFLSLLFPLSLSLPPTTSHFSPLFKEKKIKRREHRAHAAPGIACTALIYLLTNICNPGLAEQPLVITRVAPFAAGYLREASKS